MRLTVLFVALWLVAGALGCATTGGLSRSDVLEHYPQVAALHAALLNAEKDGAALIAPDGYNLAREELDEAIEEAQDGKKEKAEAAAQRGLSVLSKVNAAMSTFREIMEDVLSTRERALAAGGRNLYSEELNEAEQQLRELGREVEEGKLDKVREKRSEILALYSDIELKALKKGSVEAAKAAIAQAEKANAGKWAPKTFKLAKEQIKLVTSVLDADRTETDKARAHAAKTVWLAGRAVAIKAMAQQFKEKDYTFEDMLLWYQAQLEVLAQPLGEPLPFDQENRIVILAVRDDIENLNKTIEESRNVIRQYQGQLEGLVATAKQQRTEMEFAVREVLNADRKDLVGMRKKYAQYLSDQGKSTALSEAREVELRQKFEEIRDSFSDREAVVTMQESNVLITLPGIEYARNKVDISANSYRILNKIALAVQKMPDAKIIISGHTDSKGKESKNLEISQQRADAVLKFLTEVGGVDPKRVTALGHGPKKPVAANTSAEGRQQNRRIEVLFVNE